MADFIPITTQEEFDARISERLERQKGTLLKKYEGYASPDDLEKLKADYEKRNADIQAELDKANQKISGHAKELAERDSRIKDYEHDSKRREIARNAGLSHDAESFIQGETEEDMKKSAEVLKGLLADAKGAPPLRSGEDGAGGSDAAYRALLHSLKGE